MLLVGHLAAKTDSCYPVKGSVLKDLAGWPNLVWRKDSSLNKVWK